MSEFKPLEPRNLGHFTDVEVKTVSKEKHTPGPWTFSRWDQFGDARFYVAQKDGAPYTPHYSDVATLIAETVPSERVAIQEANANLIAAAPELLAFALSVRDLVIIPPMMTEQARQLMRLQDMAEIVIAKATGETP